MLLQLMLTNFSIIVSSLTWGNTLVVPGELLKEGKWTVRYCHRFVIIMKEDIKLYH